MREILFRGKRVDNGEWVYGFHIKNIKIKASYILTGYIEVGYDEICSWEEYLVILETVGQYTGIQDKNGKKIFEDDLIKIKNSKGNGSPGIYKVIFKKGVFGYEENKLFGSLRIWISAIWMPDDDLENFMEKVGDIHNNPELLEEDK